MIFKDKLIVITGATSGLGRELAFLLNNKSSYLALVGRNENSFNEFKNKLNSRTKFFKHDLENYENNKKLVTDIQSSFKKDINILINSAGIAILGSVKDVPIEEFNKILKVNFLSPVNLIKEILIQSSSLERVVNISSGVGYYSLPNCSAYSASKSALNSVTESLIVELYKLKIDVHNVNPGLINTNFKNNITKYGSIKNDYTNGKYNDVALIANKILKDIKKNKYNINYSKRLNLFKIIYGIFPNLITVLLKKFLI